MLYNFSYRSFISLGNGLNFESTDDIDFWVPQFCRIKVIASLADQFFVSPPHYEREFQENRLCCALKVFHLCYEKADQHVMLVEHFWCTIRMNFRQFIDSDATISNRYMRSEGRITLQRLVGRKRFLLLLPPDCSRSWTIWIPFLTL
jgi:hypothetical protein